MYKLNTSTVSLVFLLDRQLIKNSIFHFSIAYLKIWDVGLIFFFTHMEYEKTHTTLLLEI